MNSKISEVYSEALFNLGEENNSLDSKKENLVFVKKILDENEELNTIFQNPNISKEDKKEILDQIFPELEKETKNFIKVIIDKSRFNYFNQILDEFFDRYNEKNSIAVGKLTSAREMDQEDVEKIKQSLSEKLGKKVELSQELDPSLIGGFLVTIDGKMIDNSLKHKLTNLKTSLKEKR